MPEDGRYAAGTIAIARGSSPASQTTQFFIVTDDTTLDPSSGGYTVVGKVTSGLSDLVSQVTSKGIADPGADGSGKPEVPTEITGATIAREK
ncbi:peptidylprolyl isomerase [Curtobacterium sp. MCJR17_043]|uniref:peptidylprolyl isomerase n=1 Tax=Curtobacterium sp. MCJR17_043 TaxID=2175660 RepID=UPI0024DF8202|nr:peptidylprolyl isomerase [Curtobacterium sp. MCJR17_043]WIB35100.1 peptidylprolyl isomerase [Curtobacterium sp. MCJR17_043]